MRGIGKGQRIVLFVTPEVGRLLSTEAAEGRGCSAEVRAGMVSAMADPVERLRAGLEDVTAWLLINSFKSERVQFELWCLHCAQNSWRKGAFAYLQGGAHQELGAQNLGGGGGGGRGSCRSCSGVRDA